ncbi:YciI family protein [Cerasicoccus frondis]|uniref:YciI family protein n=1 Tax=Cerasicoccus frondis TaxID=490090 RepID=UPI002852CC58|nr:YciI family protein [Cerasicoccus frondis]
MKYLCVGYLDKSKMDSLTKAQIDDVMSDCPAYMDEFYDSGKVLLVAGTPPESKCMRRLDGKVEISDGPAGGASEAIGCVFLIEAADIEDAIRVASLHPTTRIAAGEKLGFRIEVSPVHYFDERALKSDAAEPK